MIRKECLQDEHLDKVARKLKIRDRQLLGRMIHALYLVELQTLAGLELTFKGGTCLSLITNRLDRLSVDVDIEISETVSPEVIEEVLNTITTNGSVFHRWESNPRPRDVAGSKHYKLHYRQDAGSSALREDFVLLDVVRTSVPTRHTTQRTLEHSILEHEGEPVLIVTPTVEGILGDKLTACAPLTVGVPIALPTIQGVARIANKHLEMVKQLFDVNVLIPLVGDWDAVGGAFSRTLEVQRQVFGHEFTTQEVVLDLVHRALAMFVQLETEYHSELASSHKDGHRSMGNFLATPGAFRFEEVKMAALRAAYVSNCVTNGVTPISTYPDITKSALGNTMIKEICKGLPKTLKAEAVAKVEALLATRHGAGE